MQTRCKEGDIAIITREVAGCESNIGRMVYVRGPLAQNSRGQPTWLIEPGDPLEPWCVGLGSKGFQQFKALDNHSVEHPDEWMVPVRPSSEYSTVEVTTDLTLEVQS